jgi:hypothetical protein
MYGIMRGGEQLPESLMSALTSWESIYFLAGLNNANNEFNGKVNHPLDTKNATVYEVVSYAIRVGLESMGKVHYKKKNEGDYKSELNLPEEKRIRKETIPIDAIKKNITKRSVESSISSNPETTKSNIGFTNSSEILDNILQLEEAYRLGQLDLVNDIKGYLDNAIKPYSDDHYLRKSYSNVLEQANKNRQTELF